MLLKVAAHAQLAYRVSVNTRRWYIVHNIPNSYTRWNVVHARERALSFSCWNVFKLANSSCMRNMHNRVRFCDQVFCKTLLHDASGRKPLMWDAEHAAMMHSRSGLRGRQGNRRRPCPVSPPTLGPSKARRQLLATQSAWGLFRDSLALSPRCDNLAAFAR
jgi:hypothetical protein